MAEKVLNGDRDQLGEYVRDIADMMGLRDWYFTLLIKPESEMDECAGTCGVQYGRKVADISFAEGWEQWDPQYLRQIVIHELVHAHTEQMTTVVTHIRERLGSEASELAERSFRIAMEHAVDGIARSWAATLPLPIKEVAPIEQSDGGEDRPWESGN